MKRTPGYPCPGCGADYCPLIRKLWLKAMASGLDAVAALATSYRDFLSEYEAWWLGDHNGN